MSLEKSFYDLLEDFLPFINDELIHNLFLSGKLPDIQNKNNEKFSTNLLNLEKYLIEESLLNNNEDSIKINEKEWKNKNGEYIIKNKKNINENILFLTNHPLKRYYEMANHFSLFFNIYGVNKRIPLSLNKIIQDKNYSLVTTSPKLLLNNTDLTNFSQSFVTITKDNENFSNNEILSLSLLTKPWYILNLNKNNVKLIKEIFDKSNSKNKVLINCLNNTNESQNLIENIYLNDIIFWLNKNKKTLNLKI